MPAGSQRDDVNIFCTTGKGHASRHACKRELCVYVEGGEGEHRFFDDRRIDRQLMVYRIFTFHYMIVLNSPSLSCLIQVLETRAKT